MKKMMLLAMMMTIAISANAMTYNAARNEALFLSDKMAYELGLTNEQYEAVYEINLDYLLNVNTRADVLGPWWDVRNRDLRFVLSTLQFDRYMASAYFYRPIVWNGGTWAFTIYNRYRPGHMFMHRPAVFVSFRGGHNHRSASFYASRHFGHPAPMRHGPAAGPGHNGNHGPAGHGNHGPAGHGNHGPAGHGNHGPSGHGNHGPAGHGNHGPAGHGNHGPSGHGNHGPMTRR